MYICVLFNDANTSRPIEHKFSRNGVKYRVKM